MFMKNVPSLSLYYSQYFQECGKWGKTAFDQGVKNALLALPDSNIVHLMINTTNKMKEISAVLDMKMCVGKYWVSLSNRINPLLE